MKEHNPTLMLFPLAKAKKIDSKFLFIGKSVSKIIYSLPYDLKNADINIDPQRYSIASLISASVYFFLFSIVGIIFGFVLTRQMEGETIVLAIIFGSIAFILSLIFHLYFPKIRAKQIAKAVEQDLLFALRTILIQVSSGISLFESMRVISRSNYGQVSEEFSEVIRDINSGMNEGQALEKLAFKTKSEILKKIIWQIITTMRSGGSVVISLRISVNELVDKQMDTIKSYAAELNMWTLIYLIVAAALPSLGVTFLVIASSIGSSGVGPDAVILIVILAISIQIALILLLRSRVPKVIK